MSNDLRNDHMAIMARNCARFEKLEGLCSSVYGLSIYADLVGCTPIETEEEKTSHAWLLTFVGEGNDEVWMVTVCTRKGCVDFSQPVNEPLPEPVCKAIRTGFARDWASSQK